MPDERTRAVVMAQGFLRDLLDPKITPRLPKEVRDRAARVLRHYPSEYEVLEAAKKAPKVFGKSEIPK